MTNNNDFNNKNQKPISSSMQEEKVDVISYAKAKFDELRSSMADSKSQSKAKVQKAKILLSEAKSIDKIRKSKEKKLDSVVKREINASAKADKELSKIESIFDKSTSKRQQLEYVALTEAIKREEIEKNLEILNVQEEVLSQDIDLTNKLLQKTTDAKNAKALEIDLKNSRYAKAVISDAYAEADRITARYSDEEHLKRVKLSNVLSKKDEEGIMQIEAEKKLMLEDAEATYLLERDEILNMPDESVSVAMREKLLRMAEAKLKDNIIIANGMANVMLNDFALDKMAEARNVLGGDMAQEKTLIIEKISAVSEAERFRIAKEREAALARIQREKDEGVMQILADPAIEEDKKEDTIKKLIKEKQAEAKEIIKRYNYEEKVRIIAGKTEIKIAFKQLAKIQKGIEKAQQTAFSNNDTELKSLDLLIEETAEKSNELDEKLYQTRRERDMQDRQHIKESMAVTNAKIHSIDTVYSEIRDFNINYTKDVDSNIEAIKQNSDIGKLQNEIDLAKQFAILDKKEQLEALKEKLLTNSVLKGKLNQAVALRQANLTDEERELVSSKKQQILDSNGDIESKIESAAKKLNAEDFLGDLLSLEDLAELEALEAELSLLESQKQEELQLLEEELLSLEESHDEDLENS